MIIYIAGPRPDTINMMMKRTDYILTSFYYQSIATSEIKPLQIIKQHNERIKNEAKKNRAHPST